MSHFIVKAITVENVNNNFTVIAPGTNNNCGINNGIAYCWGSYASIGGPGNGTTQQWLTPKAVDTTGVLSGKTITDISSGTAHTCVRASNELYCWGNNGNGQLGNNSTALSLVPVAVDMTGWLAGKTITDFSVGDAHACVVASGAAYCWGAGGNGKLGNNSTAQSNFPIPVDASGVLSGKTVTSISAGPNHTCAVASGAAYCWGINTNGQLGDSSTTQSLIPVAVNVAGDLAGKIVTDIATGTSHSCAVGTGAAYCWGINTNGRLGNNSTTQSTVPVAVNTAGVLSGVTITDVAAGGTHSCAVGGGSAYCWGAGTSGRLGNNGTTQSLVPVAVNTAGVLSGKTVTAIRASLNNTCATGGGSSYCWGSNISGQLGDRTFTQSLVPMSMQVEAFYASSPYRTYSDANSLQPGAPLGNTNQATTLTSGGGAFRLRTGILNERVPGTVTKVSTIGNFGCAVIGGAAYCWGQNTNGRLGDGTAVTTYSLAPVAVDTTGVLSGKTITDIAAGGNHGCAVADGSAYCWGNNSNGQLGNNSINQSLVPVAVDASGVLAGKTVTDITANSFHTCAIANGAAYCWGSNGNGRLGNNSTTQSLVPVAVDTSGVLSGKTMTDINAGSGQTCAIGSGAAYCWGANAIGELGNNSTTQSLVPVAVDTSGVLSGKTMTAISTSVNFTCAVGSGAAYCWGQNTSGQLGNNSTAPSSVPVAVDTSGVLSGKTITDITAGGSHGCAVGSSAAYCWGTNTNGKLGNNSITQSLVPVAVNTAGELAGKTVTAVAAGTTHSCAVASDAGYCWGLNTGGQLGNIRTAESRVPALLEINLKNHIAPGSVALKLQFAQKTAATCTQQPTGFQDVSTTSQIAWHDNPNLTNGAAISSHANDPTSSAQTIYQAYVKSGTTFTNSASIPESKYSLWDFSLKDNSGMGNTTYCLKIVYADGRNFEVRQFYPEITTADVSLSLDFVNSSGTPVANPSFAMTSTNLLTSCQLVTGVMGSLGANRLRITQGSPGNGWNVSLAATGGATSTWTRTDNNAFYDYNDSSGSPAGCNSGSDGDGLAGQLSVAANTISITPQSGCATTGLSLGGSMAGFVQGTVNAITLLTSTSGSQSNCYFDLPGMGVQQRIPSGQAQGSYEIQLTATVVAQ